MEDGGHSLLDFVIRLHQLIEINKLDISELHRITKIILKQMIEAIEYIHSKYITSSIINLALYISDTVR